MTEDHKPENTDELTRIEKAGGFVLDNRVNGELAMSRALGDFRYKVNPNLPSHEQLVICSPDVSVHERQLQEDTVMVLACDGVWDVMENELAITFLEEEFLDVNIEHETFSTETNETVSLPLQEDSPGLSDITNGHVQHNGKRKISSSSSHNSHHVEDATEDAHVHKKAKSDSSEKVSATATATATATPIEQLPADRAAKALIMTSLTKGSMDNISVIVVKFPGIINQWKSKQNGKS
jgi:serine/threonine protein phosphatase PrpC